MIQENGRLSRRAFMGRAATVVGAASLPWPVRAMANSREKRLRLGYLPITDAAPLLIAHHLGYFQDEGLVVPRPVMVRSWNILAESFLAGKFDLTHMLFPIPLWMRFKQQMPVKILAWDHTNGSAVTVDGRSGIRGFADLGGKHIAVPSWYSMHNLIMQLGIRKRGLIPVIRSQNQLLQPNEVNLFILSPPEMPPALLGKKIDGFIVAEPFNALAELKIKARIMRFTGDIWKNHPCCVLVAHERLCKQNATLVQGAVNAVVRAQCWCTKNRAEAAGILSRDGAGYLPVARDVLLRAFTGYDLPTYHAGQPPRPVMHPEWDAPRIGFQPFPYPSATEFIIRQMGKTLVEGGTGFLRSLDPVAAVRELVDDRFVIKAMKKAGTLWESPWDRGMSREEIIEID